MSLRFPLALIFLLTGALMPVNGQNIIGFAPYYRTFNAATDFSYYSHVHFFAVWPDSTGALLWPNNQDSISMHQKYLQIYGRLRPEDQKLLITFGGTSAGGSKHFSQMAGDSSTLDNFCRNAMELCKAWSATTQHHSPLSKSVNIGLNYWESKGISASKLLMGFPFYGMKYEGASQVGQSYTQVSALTYEEISEHLSLGHQEVIDVENGSYCFSESSIHIKSPSDAGFSTTLYSLDGKVEARNSESYFQAVLPVRGIQKGLYLLIVQSENQHYYHKNQIHE